MSNFPDKPNVTINKMGVNDRDLYSFKQDGDGFILRRVSDEVSHGKLDEIIGALDGSIGIITNVTGQVSSVASNTITTIVSYTVPSGKTFVVKGVTGSGENIARYDLEIDSVLQSRKRTYFGSDLNADFLFFGLTLTAGQVIRLRVEHSRPMTSDFEANIIGDLI